MKLKIFLLMTMTGLMTACSDVKKAADDFQYADEKFADIQMLRYKVEGFDQLTLKQKKLIYYLQEAALYGRDIYFDQNGRYNLRIRKMLETVYTDWKGNRESKDFKAMAEYLKQVWFSSGIHHHYGSAKFKPGFSEAFFRDALRSVDAAKLPLTQGQTVDQLCDEIFPVIFDPSIMKMRVNQKDGDDLLLTSAENYYGEGVTQAEAEKFYDNMRDKNDPEPVMYGLNSRLVKENGRLVERKWTTDGLYGPALTKIVYWLEKAIPVADTEEQKEVIRKLIEYYRTGDLRTFDEYAIDWVKDTKGMVDFTNGFTEVYGDPLGLKGTWEGIVELKDENATRRTRAIADNAQWFEDHSPVDPRFRKPKVKGVSAHVVQAVMLGGEEYPSSAIGINLPNADWIRARYGSKSVTIGNLTDAYNKAARDNGFNDEFVVDDATREMIRKYGDLCDDLHTDLHECLGHGSGQLLPGVSPDALKAYGSTIEEARADLFGLYYLADPKLVELGLVPDAEAYKSQYYHYLMNGLLTQLVRIKPGDQIEEAHMRNRAIIARWCLEHAEGSVELVAVEGKTYVRVNDYARLRQVFGSLLAEIQRIKSEGDYEAAKAMVERYGVKIDAALHREILARYEKLHIAPYKGFINPRMTPVTDAEGNIVDVRLDYTEGYSHQMMRYSQEYGLL